LAWAAIGSPFGAAKGSGSKWVPFDTRTHGIIAQSPSFPRKREQASGNDLCCEIEPDPNDITIAPRLRLRDFFFVLYSLA